MIIVDTAIQKRLEASGPIRLGLVGVGYSGRNIIHQIATAFPGIRLVAISNRTVDRATRALEGAGVDDARRADSQRQVDAIIAEGGCAVTDDPSLVCGAAEVEVVLETSGTIEFGAGVVLDAIRNRKHIVLVNVELDATLGPILKGYARDQGVMLTNTDGDEPGVAMNLLRHVRSIGLRPVVAGNLKGLYDPYRNPDTQKGFAEKHNQKATTMTSFADGTKLSMELAVLANASGFRVGKRGMYGPKLEHIREGAEFYLDKLLDGGMVDFTEGAQPANGAFVIGHTEDPVRREYLQYLKMGGGPLYVFYTPFHLPQLEVPLTVARAVLLGDETVSPIGAPVCDVVAVAKRDLRSGEVLDGLGGYTCYSLIENDDAGRQENILPMGVSEGCRLIRDVPKDRALTYDDVELPEGRLCDRLRREQRERFGKVAT